MFRRRTVRDDDRDVVYDDERRRPVADREIVDDRAPSRSERSGSTGCAELGAQHGTKYTS